MDRDCLLWSRSCSLVQVWANFLTGWVLEFDRRVGAASSRWIGCFGDPPCRRIRNVMGHICNACCFMSIGNLHLSLLKMNVISAPLNFTGAKLK